MGKSDASQGSSKSGLSKKKTAGKSKAKSKKASAKKSGGAPSAAKGTLENTPTELDCFVLAETPSTAMGNAFTSMSPAHSNSAMNAANAQNQAAITAHASTIEGLNSLFSIGNSTLGQSTKQLLEKDS